tara:strand:+ start:25 stop:306 length:282 start_codon:yes stop_codon:yes gene_type:complete
MDDTGDMIAVGAYLNDDSDKDAGHTRIYKYSLLPDDSWAWVQYGDDIQGEAIYDESGFAVALNKDGNTVAIGAPYNNGANGMDSGHVRVYTTI